MPAVGCLQTPRFPQICRGAPVGLLPRQVVFQLTDHIRLGNPGALNRQSRRFFANQNIFIFVYNFYCHVPLISGYASDLEAISNTPDCFDILRIGGVYFDFFTDFFDMDGYGRNVADRFHIPDFPKQLFFGKNMVRVLCKEGQQVEFLCRKCFLFAVNPYTPCRFIDFQSAVSIISFVF